MPDSSEMGETGGKSATGRDRAHTSRESRSSRLPRTTPLFHDEPSCITRTKGNPIHPVHVFLVDAVEHRQDGVPTVVVGTLGSSLMSCQREGHGINGAGDHPWAAYVPFLFY